MRKAFVLALVAGLFLTGSAFGDVMFSTDFEGDNPLDGWTTEGTVEVTDIAHSGTQAIYVHGDVLSMMTYYVGSWTGTVEMWIYDMGDSLDEFGGSNKFGPRWGLTDQDGSLAGGMLIDNASLDSDMGYAYTFGQKTGNSTPVIYQFLGPLAPTRKSIVKDPELAVEEFDFVHPSAGWTKWTITVADGLVTVYAENADGTESAGPKSRALDAAYNSNFVSGITIATGGRTYTSGIIVDDITFVPEPASLSLLAVGGLLAIRRR